MAVARDNPYGSFNFLVTADRFGDAASVRAGFQEVSGLGMEVSVVEYRSGNERVNRVRKVPGIYRANDVTLKRGLIGVTDLVDWIKDVRDGAQQARATVTIQLLDEARTGVVMTWRLTNAFPIKYSVAPLNARSGTDVAVEELVLACEDMDVE